MARVQVASVAAECLRAWTSGHAASARILLHDDVTFDGPLGSVRGADDYVTGLERLSETVSGAEIRQVVADGDEVCLIYDLVAGDPPVTIPTVGWYHMREGKIAAIRAFFDPRPLLPGT